MVISYVNAGLVDFAERHAAVAVLVVFLAELLPGRQWRVGGVVGPRGEKQNAIGDDGRGADVARDVFDEPALLARLEVEALEPAVRRNDDFIETVVPPMHRRAEAARRIANSLVTSLKHKIQGSILIVAEVKNNCRWTGLGFAKVWNPLKE